MKRQSNQALTAAMVASIILLVGTVLGAGVWLASRGAMPQGGTNAELRAAEAELAELQRQAKEAAMEYASTPGATPQSQMDVRNHSRQVIADIHREIIRVKAKIAALKVQER